MKANPITPQSDDAIAAQLGLRPNTPIKHTVKSRLGAHKGQKAKAKAKRRAKK